MFSTRCLRIACVIFIKHVHFSNMYEIFHKKCSSDFEEPSHIINVGVL